MICTDKICLTLISIVASPKSPQQTQWASRVPIKRVAADASGFPFFLSLFLFSLADADAYFLVFSIGFSYVFLAFITPGALDGQFLSALAPGIVVVFCFHCCTAFLSFLPDCSSSTIIPFVRILCFPVKNNVGLAPPYILLEDCSQPFTHSPAPSGIVRIASFLKSDLVST